MNLLWLRGKSDSIRTGHLGLPAETLKSNNYLLQCEDLEKCHLPQRANQLVARTGIEFAFHQETLIQVPAQPRSSQGDSGPVTLVDGGDKLKGAPPPLLLRSLLPQHC